MNDFEKGFLSGFIGYWIGSLIDRTRFGIWVNNNWIIIRAVNFLKKLILSIMVLLFVYYMYLVFTI